MMIQNKTRLTFDENQLRTVFSWMFSDGEFKPDPNDSSDKELLAKFKNACKRLGCEDYWEEWQDNAEEVDPEELKEIEDKKKEITDMSGIFYCPTCKIRTGTKTPDTKCVICNTSLHRG